MAYASRRKVAYRKKASRSTRRYSSRFASRRSGVKKRTYRKKTSLPRRKILNLTSVKKRNGMLSWSNTNQNGATQTTGVGSLFAIGGTNNIGAICIFSPTCMDLNASGAHTIGLESRRTATSCYMRGFSEHIRIQTSTGIPWFWRRICFTVKNELNTPYPGDTPVYTYRPYVETSNGLERLWLNQTINAMPSTIAGQQGVILSLIHI